MHVTTGGRKMVDDGVYPLCLSFSLDEKLELTSIPTLKRSSSKSDNDIFILFYI